MKTQNLAILLTDIAGFTAATARQSREENAAWLETHANLLKPAFAAFGGSVVKEIGDAFMVTFASPTDAVLCGMALLDRLWAYNQGSARTLRLDVRVVVNLGEVRLDKGDIFGEPVNVVARVEDVAEAGEITLTDAVFLTMNRSEVEVEPLGRTPLKGIPEPVALYRVKQVVPRPAAGELAGSYPYGGTQLHRLNAPPPGSTPRGITPFPGGAAPGMPQAAGTRMDSMRDALAGVGGRHFLRRVGVAGGLVLALLVGTMWGWSSWSAQRKDLFNRMEDRLAAGDAEAAGKLWDQAQEQDLKPGWKLDYYLGRLHAAERHCNDALDAYKDALTAHPELSADGALNDDVVSCVEGKDGRAARFLRKRLGKEAAKALAKLAGEKTASAEARLAAVDLLDSMDEGKRVAQWEVLVDILEGDHPCEQRREAVLKLAARKDGKALPGLKRALEDSNPDTGRRAKQNRCLVGALGEAIRAAEGRE